jgi:hypothetical protein
MAKKRINSCVKGKAGERELANYLKKMFPIAARRGQQHDGTEGKDVVAFEGIHLECKRYKSLNHLGAMAQATRDAGTARKGELPTVWARRDHSRWTFMCWVDDIIAVAKNIIMHLPDADRRAFAAKLNALPANGVEAEELTNVN